MSRLSTTTQLLILGALCLFFVIVGFWQVALGLAGLYAILWIVDLGIEHERSRPCPRCGERVNKGELDCPYCEFDFRTIG